MESQFQHYGIMIDNSRNAVMNLETTKKMIDILEKLGYNTLMLYTEDTYEVNNQPYFGYLRGRYSKEELKEMDAYAQEHHVELIPCIQTLAHLNALMRWPHYKEICDCNDILCAGEDKVYELVEDIFATLHECFTSRIVNIGMDEAHMVGLGKYLDKHGYCDRMKILCDHLARVAEIAKKYDYTLCMWSDMFFRITGGDYYATGDVEPSVAELIPDNVKLIYWDYYAIDKSRYDGMIQKHLKIVDDIWFAGGLWSWIGFAPHNQHALRVSRPAMQSCMEHGVKDVIFTIWGDNGGECSHFSVLPAMFYNACLGKGITDEKEIKRQFEEMFGIAFDDFMLVDLLDGPNGRTDGVVSADKYNFYSDCFLGVTDRNVHPKDARGYEEAAEKLKKLTENEEWGWLFETLYRLCKVNAVKCDLGVRTRKAYQTGDRETLQALIRDYDLVLERMERFYEAYERQWMFENKPHGFDVQDIRIGGAIRRVKHCKKRLEQYLAGKLETIAELEEQLLDIEGIGANTDERPILNIRWDELCTVNVL